MGKAAFKGAELAAATECIAELARLFPGAVPVRILVKVSKGDSANGSCSEQTLIEFATREEILFVSGLPLEFDDTVQVRSTDGTLDINAIIVAMRFHDDKMAFAAKFLEDVANWVIKA